MPLTIRDVRAGDLDSVQAINNAAGEGILPLDGARLARLNAVADYFRIAEVDGRVAGFLIAMGHDADHDSPNFEWFRLRQPAFVYIDRIVITSAARGHGLGRVFYADVQSYAEVRVPQLACEVFLEPRDDVAVLFHGTYGFREVGQQVMPGVGRRVAMLSKDLCSYGFVRDTYLAHGGLPPQPWLAGRARPVPMPQRSAAGGA
jgi:predicted GNAT superfamily acetyltransferase